MPQSRRIFATSLKVGVVAMALAATAIALTSPTAATANPLFGIAPQTALTERDAAYMQAGGIRSIRWPFAWSSIQPTSGSGFRWGPTDQLFRVAARHNLAVLPFLFAAPQWLSPKTATLPIETNRERRAWLRFVRAAVRRYGPGGGFWSQHSPLSEEPLPDRPARSWQIWNEANFFYFADPVSPRQYGRLLEISSRAIKHIDPHARVILSGLFGRPQEPRRRGLPASVFLGDLYRVPGLRRYFDGIALHPYASHVAELETLAHRMRRVADINGDRNVPLYITEMGWGSQPDPHVVSFEQGKHGQARELRHAYRYLLAHRPSLRLRAAYWFTWKDIAGSCSFCDSTGLFYGGSGFAPKPAWRALVKLTGGRLEP